MEDSLKEMQGVWSRIKARGLDEIVYSALRQSIVEQMNHSESADEAYRILLQYKLVDQLQASIEQVLNLNEGNMQS